MNPEYLFTSDGSKEQPIDSTTLSTSSSEEHNCPISYLPMRVAVITNNALTYDFLSIARWLCAPQGKNADPGAGNRPIRALIFNRIKRDNAVTLSLKEKTQIAEYCVKLSARHPKIDISTIKTLEGIQQRVEFIQKFKPVLPATVPVQREVRQHPRNIPRNISDLIIMGLMFGFVCILLLDILIAMTGIDIFFKNLHRMLLKPEFPNELALYRFETRCNSKFYMLSYFDDSDAKLYQDLMTLEYKLNTLLALKYYESKYIELKALHLSSFFPPTTSLKHIVRSVNDNLNTRPTLLFAIQLNKVNFVHNLLKFGANPGTDNRCGQNALMIAAALGDVEIIDILLESDAYPNAQDYYGWTALHVAGFTGQTHVFKRLLRAGANPNIRDIYNMTAEMYALESKQTRFLFQNLKLPKPILTSVLTKLFQRIKSQETSEIKLHSILLNSTYNLFRPNQPLCIQTLKNGDSRVELLEELTTAERENANTKCGYPTSPRFT